MEDSQRAVARRAAAADPTWTDRGELAFGTEQQHDEVDQCDT